MIKKLLAIVVLAMVASRSVAGCGGRSTNGSSSNISVTVNSQQTASQIGSGFAVSTPQAGNVFLIFNVTVTNLNENRWPIGNPPYFKLTTADNAVYSYSSSTYYLGANALNPVSDTNPGEKVTGQIAFEIPQSATATTLTYNDGLGGGSCTINIPSTSSPTPTPSSTPSVSPSSSSSHNAILESMVAERSKSINLPGWITTSWSVVWQGNDAVTMSSTGHADIQNAPVYSSKETLMIFPTSQDATNYLNAFDKSGYTLTTTDISKAGTSVYSNPTMQNPSTFQWWQRNSDSSQIYQYDNILQFFSS